VAQSFERSLEHLQTDYIDSYVLHGPYSGRGITGPDRQVWAAMEALQTGGRTRLIGVSNVSIDQLTSLYEEARVKPAFVQNRCFARTGWDREVRAFCRRHDVRYQGFSLLTANRRELATRHIRSIVQRHGRTVEQVVFRFALQVGMIPLTGTTSEAHMREDLEALDAFELDHDEVRTIEDVGAAATSAPA
jgi:diketogulonate reductase-like aldo/keto reductase